MVFFGKNKRTIFRFFYPSTYRPQLSSLVVILSIPLVVHYVHSSQKIKNKKVETEERKEMDVDELPITDLIYFDLNYDSKPYGRLVIGLYGTIVPKTVENFKQLALRKENGYTNTKIHRMIRDYIIQGGDIINNDGTGGESIYGKHFDDENFKIPHFIGSVSMSNLERKDTNSSQFYISTLDNSFLNGRNVVFGRCLTMDLVDEIENEIETKNDSPIKELKIVSCGKLERKK
eukprot:gene5066-8666_t